MTTINSYCLHIYEATVTPANDFSGAGVWTPNGAHVPTTINANETFAFEGIVVEPPAGLNTLQSGMVEVQGSPYKAATMYIQPHEYDEGQAFVTQLSGLVGKAAILSILGWGNSPEGVMTCYHSLLYWTVVKDPGNFEFAVFAAASQRILAGNVSAEPQYIDCGSTNIQTITSPQGRQTSMSNSQFAPPGIAANPPSPELLNPSFPQIG